MITIKEQAQLNEENVNLLNLQETYTSFPNHQLAINRGDDGNWWSSYYIGVSEINGESIEVLPKLENLDFMSLFSFALIYGPSAEYFSSCYDINWEKEVVASAQLYNVLTPLLVIQYLSVLEKLVGRGMKRDYITQEDNLHSKIKGRIKPISHWRQNILHKKEDHFYCQFQTYSADIPVNRLLKKALDISMWLIGDVRSKSQSLTGSSFFASKLKLLDAFRNISSDIRIQEVKNFKFDKLNMFYSEAIRLAKCIIRHQDNALKGDSGLKKVPLFWIDMSRLYEVYVLGILREQYPQQILFQVKGSYETQCDYLHIGEGIVLDAKYKLWYASDDGRYWNRKALVADIREVSGYARDIKLISHFNKEVSSPLCVIIHPDEHSTQLGPDLTQSIKQNKIEGYKDFYRLGIKLPQFHEN